MEERGRYFLKTFCEAFSEAAAEGGSEAIAVASFSNTEVPLRIFKFHILRLRFPVGARFDGYYAYDKDRETQKSGNRVLPIKSCAIYLQDSFYSKICRNECILETVYIG